MEPDIGFKQQSEELDSNIFDLKLFAARLNSALDDMNVPKKGFGRQMYACRLFGSSQKTVRRWLEGIGWPNKSEWPGIAAASDCRLEWLFFGLGPRRENKPQTYDHQIMATVMTSVDHIISKYQLQNYKGLKADLTISLFDEMVKILPESD